jgi:hypothetical protein
MSTECAKIMPISFGLHLHLKLLFAERRMIVNSVTPSKPA